MNKKISIPSSQLDETLAVLNQHILGNPQATKLALCCVIAGGHILLDDVPGVGKTTLAKTLAQLFGLDFQRVQFTNDLMPSDLIGVSIYNQTSHSFDFKPGPLFTSALLADEINRASPKTQSALLQAMEEQEVTADGKSYTLPKPFFVLATQNPSDQSGTSPLPESQLDRFLMRLSLGFPSADAEFQLLKNQRMINNALIKPTMTSEQLATITAMVTQVLCSDAIISYMQRLLQATRESTHFKSGLSPRAALQWLQAARAWAVLDKRDFVLPEDVQAVAPHVALHRLSTHFTEAHISEFKKIMETTPVD
ncbi:MAG: AAA family ATPase [Arenicella sp.]